MPTHGPTNRVIRTTTNNMTIKSLAVAEVKKVRTFWPWYILALMAFVVYPAITDYIDSYQLEREIERILQAPDSAYLDFVKYTPEDICIEDTEQDILLERRVLGTKTGWAAAVIDELGVKATNGAWGKYGNEYVYTPFYEVIEADEFTPANTKIFTVPLQDKLRPGTYRWEAQITLKIPLSNGQILDKPLDRKYSDMFEVTESCRHDRTIEEIIKSNLSV